MGNFFKILSLAPRGIREKLVVAFALMAVIPMLVCGYLIIYYIFPTVEDFGDVSLVFLITIFLMVMGFYLARKIIYPIARIATHAKIIAEGGLDETLKIQGEDEIGQLSGSLNKLSSRLKQNMTELHSYGEKIKQINMEINKKVFALSSLLQIGNLITTTADLNEVFNLIVDKLSQLEGGGPAFLMLVEEDTGTLAVRAQTNIEGSQIGEMKLKVGQGVLGELVTSAQALIKDDQKRPKAVDEDLRRLLLVENMAVLPITSSGKVIGILGTGNNLENFLFSDDEIELIGVFAKQVAVAIENAFLLNKTEELTVRDELTGLYNENYIRSRLDEEIKRAISYQRPCSLVILAVNNLQRYYQMVGEIGVERILKKIAKTLGESTSEIDKVARFSEDQFALVLPEKNRQDSAKLAENINQEIKRFAFAQNKEKESAAVPLTLSIGISATPIDGTSAAELINKALYYIEKEKK